MNQAIFEKVDRHQEFEVFHKGKRIRYRKRQLHNTRQRIERQWYIKGCIWMKNAIVTRCFTAKGVKV